MKRYVLIRDEHSKIFGHRILNSTLSLYMGLLQLMVCFWSLAQHFYSIAYFNKILHCDFSANSTLPPMLTAVDAIIFDVGMFHHLWGITGCVAQHLDGGYGRFAWCWSHTFCLIFCLPFAFVRRPKPYYLWPLLIQQSAYGVGMLILSLAALPRVLPTFMGDLSNAPIHAILVYLIGTLMNFFLLYIYWHWYWYVEEMWNSARKIRHEQFQRSHSIRTAGVFTERPIHPPMRKPPESLESDLKDQSLPITNGHLPLYNLGTRANGQVVGNKYRSNNAPNGCETDGRRRLSSMAFQRRPNGEAEEEPVDGVFDKVDDQRTQEMFVKEPAFVNHSVKSKVFDSPTGSNSSSLHRLPKIDPVTNDTSSFSIGSLAGQGRRPSAIVGISPQRRQSAIVYATKGAGTKTMATGMGSELAQIERIDCARKQKRQNQGQKCSGTSSGSDSGTGTGTTGTSSITAIPLTVTTQQIYKNNGTGPKARNVPRSELKQEQYEDPSLNRRREVILQMHKQLSIAEDRGQAAFNAESQQRQIPIQKLTGESDLRPTERRLLPLMNSFEEETDEGRNFSGWPKSARMCSPIVIQSPRHSSEGHLHKHLPLRPMAMILNPGRRRIIYQRPPPGFLYHRSLDNDLSSQPKLGKRGTDSRFARSSGISVQKHQPHHHAFTPISTRTNNPSNLPIANPAQSWQLCDSWQSQYTLVNRQRNHGQCDTRTTSLPLTVTSMAQKVPKADWNRAIYPNDPPRQLSQNPIVLHMGNVRPDRWLYSSNSSSSLLTRQNNKGYHQHSITVNSGRFPLNHL